jgi:hypothetical protein
MKRIAPPILLLLTAACLTLAGCSGTVTGEVSGKSNQKPVPQATVVVGDQTAVTDSTGHFTVDKVETGSQNVAAQAQGFGDFNGPVDVKRGSNTLNIVLIDGAVHGVLKENAGGKSPIKAAKVTLGVGRARTEGAKFELDGVPVGTHAMKVEAPGHATYRESVEIKPGDNQLTVQLELTPVETYMRYYQAYRFGRYREGYKFVHAAVKKHYSFKRFHKDMSTGGEIVGIKIFGTRHMAKWRPAYSKQTFKDVVAIDRALRTQSAFGAYTDNYTQHWQQLHGRWYIIFDWRE